jgi:hypothetical protein
MALTDRLFDNLRVALPGVTDNALKLELYNVLDDFCRDASVWRETIEVPLIEGMDTYLVTPAGTEITRVYNIDHATLDVANATYEFGQLLFDQAPTLADTEAPAYLTVALTPALTQGADPENMLPEDMWSLWHRAILSGTMARMMGQPAKPYSNPQQAVLRHTEYVQQKAVAKRYTETGGQPGAQLWRFPRMGVR